MFMSSQVTAAEVAYRRERIANSFSRHPHHQRGPRGSFLARVGGLRSRRHAPEPRPSSASASKVTSAGA